MKFFMLRDRTEQKIPSWGWPFRKRARRPSFMRSSLTIPPVDVERPVTSAEELSRGRAMEAIVVAAASRNVRRCMKLLSSQSRDFSGVSSRMFQRDGALSIEMTELSDAFC